MTENSRRWYTRVAVVSAVLFVIDRLSKYASVHFISEPVSVIPGVLELTLLYNDHFLFLWQSPRWVMGLVSGIVMLIMLYLLWREYIGDNRWHVATILVIFVGALSNLIDRLRYGAVIDFLNVPFWAVFNLADVYIVGGVILLIVSTWKYDTEKAVPKTD